MNKWINQFADVFREYLYFMHPNYEGGYKNPYEEQAFLKSQVKLKKVKTPEENSSLRPSNSPLLWRVRTRL